MKNIGKVLKTMSAITLVGGFVSLSSTLSLPEEYIGIVAVVIISAVLVSAAVLYGIGTTVDNTEENKQLLNHIIDRLNENQYRTANYTQNTRKNGQEEPMKPSGATDGGESFCMLPCPGCGRYVDVLKLGADKRCPHCNEKYK